MAQPKPKDAKDTMASPISQQKGGSTRLAIVEQAIVDTVERLRDISPSPRVRELRTKAEGYERALRAWVTRPPTEEQRAALLKLVLELNVEVISLGRSSSK
ncbi:MAG: hypothetical protein ABSC94_08895 [Polyangiaceae bacterium]|jgi:hypothetical protein